jgi:hypothetical protein
MSNRKRNSFIVLGLLLIIVAAIGISRRPKKEPVDELDISFTESELEALGNSIEGLEFDDLGGLSESEEIVFEFTEEDLDKLGSALEELEFEDLGGLTEN